MSESHRYAQWEPLQRLYRSFCELKEGGDNADISESLFRGCVEERRVNNECPYLGVQKVDDIYLECNNSIHKWP